jgi:N-acetylmuramoyl-L-alanine amidase CwlA
MTTIDESKTAKGYTPAAQVPQVFGQARTIEGIVIHHWGLTGQTHDGVVDFFVNGPGQTSAHFVASAGRINCLVSPPDAAWHCPGKNATHIGIECRPEATDADYATVAELVSTLRAQYGPLPLSMHRDWYNTACPGVWDLARIDQLAGQAAINPQSTTTQEDATMAKLDDDDRKFIQELVNGAINQIWGTADVSQKLIQSVAVGLNNIKAGAVDVNAVAKAVNDDAAARMAK